MISTQLISPKGPIGRIRFLEEMAYATLNIITVVPRNVDCTNAVSILIATADKEATDARDSLYAIKGLLSKEDTDIEIDYSRSAEAVYSAWSLRRMRRTRSVDVLMLCVDSGGDSCTKKLPSWTPDLRRRSPADSKFFLLANGMGPGEYRPYAAAGDRPCGEISTCNGNSPKPLQGFDGRDSILSLQGIHIDTIVKRLSPVRSFDRNFISNQLPPATTLLEEQISEHFGTTLLPNTEIYRAFVCSLFKGYKWHSDDTIDTLPNRYGVWRGHSDIPAEFEPRLPQIERRKVFLGRLELVLATVLTNSDLFITSNGLIGAISRRCHAKAGDETYVLLGGDTPFILKPLKGRNDYRLRSACFMHGYMNGEAISAWKKGELELGTINIV
ncbi:hypothetical protein DL95DRAFT_399465 [Leptodontidium sp. 2 PMI_412]|nr:hypothetical protein DL95DRAFT_399465 [Leptodontidium sp. 2 PMI_412]